MLDFVAMRQIPVRLWLLAVVSGVLQVLAFPLTQQIQGWPVLAWAGPVFLLLALLDTNAEGQALTVKQGAAVGYACGIVWYIGNCWWIYQTMYLYGGLPKPVAAVILLLFAMYLGLYHALFGALMAGLRRLGTGWALALAPFCWVAVELARARITGFPWDLLGNSQVDNALPSHLAPFAGVMAVSFVVAGVNASVASVFFQRTRLRLSLAAVFVLVAGGLTVLPPLDMPLLNKHQFSTAVLLQENLEVGAVGKEAAPLTMEEKYREFSRLSEHPLWSPAATADGFAAWQQAEPAPAPALVVWPEAPADFLTSDERFRGILGDVARATRAPVIAGSLGVDRDPGVQRGYKLYDSAALIAPDGGFQGRYDKIHLVPWGEYVPFKELFFFAGKLTAGVGNMDPGSRRDLFHAGGHVYGVFICYESIFGDEVREFVKNGAEVLVNISDDGWYGDTGAPWQHLNMARMRAIENRRWVIRDTNTGVTTTIDPFGRTMLEAPRHVRGAYAMPFEYKSRVTFYTRHGDWFAWVCLCVTLAGLGWARLTQTKVEADALRG
ncbi:apolipoprotein N-acyltransferase [Granulicella rosea]|uniref:Apolipoprotein N-acyltransferase n=2 Tax=Granulicella rosea TaxID=474952 RepID=A0A239IUK3_9BACT|nr:apolipoprotein N-acyltransferase [Granulicella rosea]